MRNRVLLSNTGNPSRSPMITFIVNPAAGHGRVRRMMPQLEKAVTSAPVPTAWQESISAGHCKQLAREAAAVSSLVVAVGGDGTANLVASGILAADHRPPMAVFPVGTGNDFAYMFKSERHIGRFLAGLAHAETVWTDYGVLRWEDRDGEHQSIFLNVAGLGFDGAANVEAVRYKMLPGSRLGYLVGVLNTLRKWKNPRVKATWIREDGSAGAYEGSFLLADASNGQRLGGGFYLTPDATVTDGALDLCLVRGASARRILHILPLALRPGPDLARQPEVIAERIQSVRVRSEMALPLHCDGEIVSGSCRLFESSIFPAGLEVRVVRAAT